MIFCTAHRTRPEPATVPAPAAAQPGDRRRAETSPPAAPPITDWASI